MKQILLFSVMVISFSRLSLAMDNPNPPAAPSTKRLAGQEVHSPRKARKIDIVQPSVPLSNPGSKLIRTTTSQSQLPNLQLSPFKEYYTTSNLQQLISKNMPVHIPCYFLLDPANADTKDFVMSDSLKNAINQAATDDEFPIIASTGLFYRLIKQLISQKGMTPEQKNFSSDLNLDTTKWNVYQSPGAYFIVLVPKKFITMYEAAQARLDFNLTHFKDLTSIIRPHKQKCYETLVEKIKNFPPKTTLNFNTLFKDFTQLFSTHNDCGSVWDFIISAHGSSNPPNIGTLSPKKFNKILSLFDNRINVGTVFIEACAIGGEILNLFEYIEPTIKANHTYILMVGALSDMPAMGLETQKYGTFFNLAAQLADKGTSINQLLKAVAHISIDLHKPLSAEELVDLEKAPFPLISIYSRESFGVPQVWLPNGVGFQTFNIDKYIKVLNEVIVRSAQEDKKPLVITDKRAVLLYPTIVTPPLEIGLWVQTNPDQSALSLYKTKMLTFDAIPMVTEPAFWKNTDLAQQHEAVTQLRHVYPELTSFFEKSEKSYLFPQIISLTRGNTHHYINAINLLNAHELSSGVVRFMRDAFLDISERVSVKTFVIENITGYNDLSLLLEASRLLKKIDQPHPLENLLAAKRNQPITLSHVIISSHFNNDQHQNEFLVTFAIDNNAWAFRSQDSTLWASSYMWNFLHAQFDHHEKNFAELKQQIIEQEEDDGKVCAGQKSISQVVEQQKALMYIKKERAAKQKEVIEQVLENYKKSQK